MSIHHYTDMHALMSIVEKGELWLSHLEYLNDGDELECGFKAVVVAKNLWLGSFENAEEISERTIIEKVRKSDIYSMSFSKNPNTLSMWRSYCPKGAGIAIGFDEEKIKAICEKYAEAYYGKCRYDNIDEYVNEKIIQPLVFNKDRQLTKAADGLFLSGKLGFNEVECANNIYVALSMLIPFVKHADFREEQESRLVFLGAGQIAEEYRVRDGVLVPFIKLNEKDSISSMIESIMIGPGAKPYQERVKKSLDRFLATKGMSHVTVSISNTPLITNG